MPHTREAIESYTKQWANITGLALHPFTATASKQFVQPNAKMMRYAICKDIDGQMKAEYMPRTGTAGIPTVLNHQQRRPASVDRTPQKHEWTDC